MSKTTKCKKKKVKKCDNKKQNKRNVIRQQRGKKK